MLPSMGSQRVGQDLVSEQQFCWSGLVVVSLYNIILYLYIYTYMYTYIYIYTCVYIYIYNILVYFSSN